MERGYIGKMTVSPTATVAGVSTRRDVFLVALVSGWLHHHCRRCLLSGHWLRLAVGETVIFLTPPFSSILKHLLKWRGGVRVQQNDSLAHGQLRCTFRLGLRGRRETDCSRRRLVRV